MAELRRQGLDEVLRARIADGRPVLGICLGLQLAVERSEEDGGVDGLGILPGSARASARGPRAAHRLGRGRRDRVLLRALVRGRDAGRDRVVGGHRRRGALAARSSACSSTRRRAAPRARATSTACSRR